MKNKVIDIIKRYFFRFVFSCIIFSLFYLLAIYYNKFIVQKYILQQDDNKDEKNIKIKKVNLVYYQFANFVYYLILMIGLSFSFSILGISNTAIFTILGTIGLSLALAMKESLSNFVAGIMISLKDQYQIGDYISVISSGREKIKGYVKEYNLLDTVLIDEDHNLFVIPNTMIFDNIMIISPQ